MMEKVTYDQLHDLINHPDVRPHLGKPGEDDLDITHRLKGAFFSGDIFTGGTLFIHVAACPEGDIYETHFMFTRAVRGRQALASIKEALSYAFTERNAAAIVGAIPLTHRASRFMAAAIRAEKVAERPDATGQMCAVYVLERRRWAT
jgi:hypothetical protein